MAFERRILYSAECDKAAEALGGYRRIDASIDAAVWDALTRNPYGFKEASFGWHSVRYIVTKPIHGTPALLWLFRIEGGDVIIEHVEQFEGY